MPYIKEGICCCKKDNIGNNEKEIPNNEFQGRKLYID